MHANKGKGKGEYARRVYSQQSRASRTQKNKNEQIVPQDVPKSREEDELDRLKEIKARLRRNFQNKVFDGNTPYAQNEEDEERVEI